VVDSLVVSFTVELSGEGKKVKVDMFVLMAFYVLKAWLKLS
jgi:hypothetical protein